MSSTFIVVTDLDGTLLDHHSYSWHAAHEAIALLKARNIPLVLCSSKTAAEIVPLWQALGITAPFIVENGGAVYLPDESSDTTEIIPFGMNRAEVLPLLALAREETGAKFTSFSDMTVSDVSAVTGLGKQEAASALQREFTEPLLWQDSDESKQRFIARLKKDGLSAVQGGRFLTVSAGADKGAAVRWLRRYYVKNTGEQVQLIALGDSENDVSMLEEADYPVLIRSPVKPFPNVHIENVERTEEYGPKGWNIAIRKILL